ncbi:MAG: phosphodiester glycosidase family protein [Lachnospiraceae bacterium]
MGPFKKKYDWAVFYAILLVSFTCYVVLDTFVIARVYTTVPTDEDDNSSSAETESDSQFTESAEITDHSYSDQNISITITEYREYDTAIYVADVYVSSAEYLLTAFAQSSYGRNVTEKTSAIAAANNALLAINGDYYGSQEKGYVLKNGSLYRETSSSNQEDLVIWEDGSFEIITEGEVTAAALLENGALQVLSFGPALIMDGSISVSESEEVGKAMVSNPRTAIGIVDDLHYLFVVSDGRTDESEGLTLYQLAAFMQSLDADIAYNLDGGGSSTMYFNGEIINNPTTNGNSIKERSVSDIVYIGY